MLKRTLARGVLIFAISGCESKSAVPAVTPVASPAIQAPTNIPANMSHGEAPVGTAVDSAPVNPTAPARSTTHLVRVRFDVKDAVIQVSKSVQYRAWTFESTVPGPVVRVTQGDTVDFTLVNHGTMPHSMDFHAAQIAPNKYYVNVAKSDSLHYRFAAEVPDVFMYHCGTAVVNAGPNRLSSFHVVGGIFERVFVDGSQTNPLAGVQTVAVPVGGGSIFEIRLKEPGEYPFVTHAFADATKGAVGVMLAER